MKLSTAYSIFNHLNNDEEKAWAIKIVIDMATHNGVTKDQILNATRWLWSHCWEIKEEAQE